MIKNKTTHNNPPPCLQDVLGVAVLLVAALLLVHHVGQHPARLPQLHQLLEDLQQRQLRGTASVWQLQKQSKDASSQ
jgi:hypothetical protein